MKTSFIRSVVFTACTVFLAAIAFARPRPPVMPYPECELKSWKFDIPDYVNAQSMGAHIATNLWLAESWSGYALDMRAQGSLLLTPAVLGPHRTNFTEGSGTIRLWYSPTAWASASVGGTGPGEWATLFELEQTNTVDHPFGLALSIDPFGTNLVAAVNTETGAVTLVQTAIAWSTGQWHQIAFIYDTNAVEIFVDDNNDTVSFNVPTWPSSSIWNQSGFSLASGFDGQKLAQGQLDEIHTFGYPLSTNYLTWMYQLYAPIATLGPLLDEEGGGGTPSVPSPCDPCPAGDTNSTPVNYDAKWANTGLRFSSNAAPYFLNATNYVTTLAGTEANRAYQIFRTTNLLSPPTNTVWVLSTNGATNQVTFTNIVTTNMTNQFFLAAPYDDYDQNGVGDAQQWLVDHFDVHTDSDGDGLPDGYELSHGTNPNLFDSDTNGMGDQLFTLSWWIKEDTANFDDDLILGDGFRVHWNTGIILFLNQIYLEFPVRDWLTTSQDANGYFPQADWFGDSAWHQWKVEYDYRTVRIHHYATNGTDNVVTQWVDNMTERLGTNAATTVSLNSLATMSNVVVQHFKYPRKSPQIWEGVIGNTSDSHYGPSMHAPWWPIKAMTLNGSNLLYTCEYNEGNYQIQMFSPTNPQVVLTNFSWKTAFTNSKYGQTFTNLAVQTNAIFAAGNTFQRYFRVANTNVDTLETIEYDSNGAPQTAPHGLTKLSTSSPTNIVLWCMADSSGSLPGQLSKTQPYFLRVSNSTLITLHTNAMGALFNSNRANLVATNANTHWLNIRGLVYFFNATNFTFIGSNNWNFPAQPNATNLNPPIAASDRLAVATNPVDGKIAVFDGSSQQVKIYNANGTNVVLTIGVANGYSNGPAVPYPAIGDTNFANVVKLGGYYDDEGKRIPRATVCYQMDGKLWVSDSATARMFRFNLDGSLDGFIETIPHNYRVSIDPRTTNRLFVNFLEFRIDHSQPLRTCWVLTNYWGHDFMTTNGTKTTFVADFPYGLQTVTTVTNSGGTNRTFAIVDYTRSNTRLVELTSAGMRATLSDNLPQFYELDTNGAVNVILTNAQVRSFERSNLVFSASGVPYLAAAQSLAPTMSNYVGFPVSPTFKVAGTKFIIFDPIVTDVEFGFHSGLHLGAVANTGSLTRSWVWTNAPSGVMDGRGTFETNAGYGGQQFILVDDNIFFVYEGEGWRGGKGLANQIFHFKTDGRFVQQFGLPLGKDGNTPNPPGSPSNLFTISAVRIGNTLYLYANDEASRGVHRWRLNL